MLFRSKKTLGVDLDPPAPPLHFRLLNPTLLDHVSPARATTSVTKTASLVTDPRTETALLVSPEINVAPLLVSLLVVPSSNVLTTPSVTPPIEMSSGVPNILNSLAMTPTNSLTLSWLTKSYRIISHVAG